jgi:hypothetical protein
MTFSAFLEAEHPLPLEGSGVITIIIGRRPGDP